MKTQTKSKNAICSSIGDVTKHEKFKKLSTQKRISILQETYDKYGIHSNEFFIQVKPFIMWAIYKNLRGMPTEFLEDLVNQAYQDLIIDFEGGETSHYRKVIQKEPLYNAPGYKEKYKNIGNFVLKRVTSSVVKYRSKTFRKKFVHEDSSEDISDRLNFTDFEIDNNLDYEFKAPNVTYPFKFFKFNDEFLKHLKLLKETKPKNNILYNFMLWRELV